MAQISFNLKEANSDSETLIYLMYRNKKDRIKLSIGEKVNPRHWNPEKQRARFIRGREDLAEQEMI